MPTRNVPIGGRGDIPPSIGSKLQESWSKGSHAPREFKTAFSVTFFLNSTSWPIGQNAPPTGVSAHH